MASVFEASYGLSYFRYLHNLHFYISLLFTVQILFSDIM